MAGRSKVVVNEKTFYIKKFEPFKSVHIFGELQKKLIGPLSKMDAEGQFDDIKLDSTDAPKKDQFTSILKAVNNLSSTLDGKTLQGVVRMLLDEEYVSVSVEGGDTEKLTESMVNRTFDDVTDLFELAVQVAMVNYSSVFTKGLSRIGAALKSRGLNIQAGSLLK